MGGVSLEDGRVFFRTIETCRTGRGKSWQTLAARSRALPRLGCPFHLCSPNPRSMSKNRRAAKENSMVPSRCRSPVCRPHRLSWIASSSPESNSTRREGARDGYHPSRYPSCVSPIRSSPLLATAIAPHRISKKGGRRALLLVRHLSVGRSRPWPHHPYLPSAPSRRSLL